MRFEVRYPTGAHHEVELSGSLAVLGRDPSSDLVLNDPKCSRRHAVIEAGPDGLAIRDAGSANGVYVNGKKTERARIVDGDEIRLGDVVVRVLSEDVAGTLVMAPEDMDDMTTRPTRATPPEVLAAPSPPRRPVAPSAPPPLPPASSQPAPPPARPPVPAPPAAPPPPPSAPRSRPGEMPAAAQPNRQGKGSTMLIVGALGCLALLLLTALAAVVIYFVVKERAKASAEGAACVERMKALAVAEDAFRSGTCGAYADMEGLTNPASVIPRYPETAPPFLSTEQATPVAFGCRYELRVDDPVAPSVGCPSRSFRRYVLAAAPVAGQGRFMRLGNDGVIHFAEGRPATEDDPILKP